MQGAPDDRHVPVRHQPEPDRARAARRELAVFFLVLIALSALADTPAESTGQKAHPAGDVGTGGKLADHGWITRAGIRDVSFRVGGWTGARQPMTAMAEAAIAVELS